MVDVCPWQLAPRVIGVPSCALPAVTPDHPTSQAGPVARKSVSSRAVTPPTHESSSSHPARGRRGYGDRMGFRDKVTSARIDTAAQARLKAGHRVFAYRLQVPQLPDNDMSSVADAIESVEAVGWRLEQMQPDTFTGQSAVGVNTSWMLVFRARV